MTFSVKNFLLGGKFQGEGKLSGGNLTLGKFVRIPIRNSFNLAYFFFAESTLNVKMLRVIVRGKFSPGWNFLEDLSVGRFINP